MLEKLRNKYQAVKNWYSQLSRKRKIIVFVLLGGKMLIDILFLIFFYSYLIG